MVPGSPRDRISLAILALGGQGGGVLADWILDLAAANGYVAQGTSVPGVAQRTGSTVYYIEMIRKASGAANQPEPVLALMPVPGDVDIVIASELMEAGRAILRGFVSTERTTLIGSTHRIYAISEKSALGDGTAASHRIIDAAHRRSKRFVGFDMDDAANRSRSVISSVMFGALAGSGALPFPRSAFEEAIRRGGKAIDSNLTGFQTGLEQADHVHVEPVAVSTPPKPKTEAGRARYTRIKTSLPEPVQAIALEGVRRLFDYQDAAYADLYLSRLAKVATLDSAAENYRLSTTVARQLALWMSFEDTIRVADLKIRGARMRRVEKEVRAAPGQLLAVTEYMHPRLQEVCELLPPRIGNAILGSPRCVRWLSPLFRKGRTVEVTSLRWNLLLRGLAAMRRIRRTTLRFQVEQQRICAWLDQIGRLSQQDRALACEIAEAQGLIKGYSDTFEKSLERFGKVSAAADRLSGSPSASARLAEIRLAAMADEDGDCLDEALRRTA